MKTIGILASVMFALNGLSAHGSESEDRHERHEKEWQFANCQPFSELRMTLEQNATDGDTEVVLFAKGQDDGLHALTITAPNGRKVAKINGDKRGIGIREFALESAEPPDLSLVLDSFPEGMYRMRGTTVTGECLAGSAYLSHKVAPAAELLTPAEDEVVSINNVVLSWSDVAAAAHYVVELENKTLGNRFSFQIFPPATRLAIPAAMLVADSTYQFGVAVRTYDGNLTLVETSFFTEP